MESHDYLNAEMLQLLLLINSISQSNQEVSGTNVLQNRENWRKSENREDLIEESIM